MPPVAIAGEAIQGHPRSNRKVRRARDEEFGDVLAEGMYWLIDEGKSSLDANKKHWAVFLQKRRKFIDVVLEMTRDSDMPPWEVTGHP